MRRSREIRRWSWARSRGEKKDGKGNSSGRGGKLVGLLHKTPTGEGRDWRRGRRRKLGR